MRIFRGFSVVLACLLAGSTINAGVAVAADPAPPEVAVAITAGDFVAGNNGNGLWKIQVSNPTGTPLTGPITATVTVPSPVSLDTEVGSVGWRCTGVGTTTATCTLDQALGANAPAPLLQLPVVLPQGVTGTTTATAEISAATGILPETVTASATGEATIKPMPTPTPPPVDPAKGVDLGVDAPYNKTLLGQPVTQEIRVYNSGDVASSGPTTVTVKVTDATFSGSRNYTPGDGWRCTYASQTPLILTCTNPNGVPAGGELPKLTIATRDLTIPRGGGTAPERVRFEIAVSSPSTDVYPRDNSTVALPIVLVETNLRLDKYLASPANPAPGSRLTYILGIDAGWQAGLKGPFIIEDQLPVGTTFVSGSEPWACTFDAANGPAGTVRCVLEGDIFSQLQLVLDLSEDAEIGSVVTNTASITSATPEIEFTDNTTSSAFEVAPPVYTMAMWKAAPHFETWHYRYYFLDSEPMDWQIRVFNTSNLAIKGGVVVTDTLPAGLTYVGFTGDGWTCSSDGVVPPTVTCTYAGTIANDDFRDLYIRTQPTAPTTQPQTPYTNKATVAAVRDPGTTLATATTTAWIYWGYDVTVTKSAPYPFYAGAGGSTSFSQIGQLITGSPAWNVWRVTLSNNTDRPIVQHAYGFHVYDTLPAGSKYVGTLTGQSCYQFWDGTLYCYILQDIPVGGSITIDIVATVPPDTPADTVLTNKAWLEWQYDPNMDNNTATATATVLPLASDVSLRKSEGVLDQVTGTITYEVFATNNGPSNYVGPIRVIDNLPTRTDGTGHLVAQSVTVGSEVQGSCAVSSTATQDTVTCDVTAAPVMLTGIEYKVATIVTKSSNTTDPLQNFERNCAALDWSATGSPVGDNPGNDSSCTTVGVIWDQTVKTYNLGISKSTNYSFPVWDVQTKAMTPLYAVVAGQQISYHVVVSNTGKNPWDRTIPVRDVFTSDVPLEFVSAGGGGFTCTATNFTNTTPAFTAGATPSVSCLSDTDVPVGGEVAFDIVVKATTDKAVDNTVSFDQAAGFADNDFRDNASTVQIPASSSSGPYIYKDFVIDNTSSGEITTVGPSGAGSFHLYVSAYGDYGVAPLTLTDQIPDGFTITGVRNYVDQYYQHAAMACTTTGQTVNCVYSEHPYLRNSTGGWLAMVIVDVTWTGLPGGDHVNTASLTDGLNRSVTDSVTVRVPSLDLAITKSTPIGETPMPIGSIVPFTIVVRNNGATPFNDPLIFTDEINTDTFEIISISGEGWSCPGAPSLTCVSNQDLPSGGKSTPVNIVTRLKTVGGDNEAQLIAPDGDEVPWNNSSNVWIRGSRSPLADDLAVRTNVRGRLTPGTTVPWNIAVSNPGPRDITDTIRVTAVVPAGLTYAGFTGPDGWSCTATTATPQVVTCLNETDVPAGAPAYAPLDLLLTADTALTGWELFTLTAMLGTDNLLDLNVGNNQADEWAQAEPLPHPGLTLVKKTNTVEVTQPSEVPYLPVGSAVTWTYVVTNTGDRPLTGLALVDDVEGTITCPVDSLGIGEWTTCTKTGVVVAGGYANSATASANGPGPDGPTTVTSTDTSGYFGYVTGVSISKEVCTQTDPASCDAGNDSHWAEVATVATGSKAVWRITVRNTGNVDLAEVAVTDAQASACTLAIGDLSVEGERRYTCESPAVTATTRNVAQVAATAVNADGAPIVDPVTGVRPPVVTGTDSAEVTVSASPSPTLPTTGADVQAPLGAGLVLLLLGATGVALGRSRRRMS